MKSSSRAGSEDNSDEEADFPAKLPPRILESLRAFTSLTFRFTSKSRARPGIPYDFKDGVTARQMVLFVLLSSATTRLVSSGSSPLSLFSGSSFSPPFVTLSGSSPVLLCLHLCYIISLPYPLHKLCFVPHLLFSNNRP